MKFMIGYQLMEDTSLVEAVIRYREYISEIYFSWDNIPNGRGIMENQVLMPVYEAQNRQISDLEKMADKGLKFNLLLNGNCYGSQSLARSFYSKIGDTIDYLSYKIGINSITTTSPVIARFIKNNFSEIKIRASVNMEIGSLQGMDYISDYFDGYYMQRELNRNLTAIKKLKQWCDDNGKEMYLLANSGCLNNCSVHNFHDNLVAHEHEIATMDNAFDFRGICHEYLAKEEKQASIIRDTNFIRPEDLYLYEPYFSAVKLATRTNRNPVAVIEAYMKAKYNGNILDLLEPNHSESFYPYILDNTKFPKNFTPKIISCNKDCSNCGFCSEMLDKVKFNLNKIGESVCVNE